MLEKDFEDILCKYHELIEGGLILKGRQLTVYGRRIDLLFEDNNKARLLVEIKVGPIKDKHIGQLLAYEGMLLSSDDPTLRIMLIGNRVPPNIRKALDHHGIAWKEITFMELKDFLAQKNDHDYLKLFENLATVSNNSTDMSGESRTLIMKNSPEKVQKGVPGWRSREKRKISSSSPAGQIILEYLMAKGEPATMSEIAAYMHSKGYKSRTFYNWSDGLVASGLAEETTKNCRRAYKAKRG